MSQRYVRHRDTIHGDVVKALEACGCTVEDFGSRTTAGVPDLVIGCFGINVLAEVKSGEKAAKRKSATATAQCDWRDWWRGDKPVLITSVDDALALVARMRGRMTSSEVGT